MVASEKDTDPIPDMLSGGWIPVWMLKRTADRR